MQILEWRRDTLARVQTVQKDRQRCMAQVQLSLVSFLPCASARPPFAPCLHFRKSLLSVEREYGLVVDVGMPVCLPMLIT